MSSFLAQRLSNCQALLEKKGLEAILITNLTNIYYLTGFSGTSATVFISPKRRIFITDSRYTLIAKASIEGFDIIESRTPLAEIAAILQADKLSSLAFEDQVSFSFYQHLQRSEEHTSELQSRQYLVCRLLLEKKKTTLKQI